mgnify:CR=1 FL=1|tara:strand:+ start:186 stop:713 length:528 start_codon:yes stop_codon:yes gene_type:complete
MKDGRGHIRNLLEYNGWANDQLYAKVSELPPVEVTKERETVLKSIFVSLNHLLSVDMIWLAHMQERSHGISELRGTIHTELGDLWQSRQRMDSEMLEYFESLEIEELEEIVNYELIGGNTGSLSRANCFFHLVTHGSYHRGWIADMFGQAGSVPPIIDLPVYERFIRENNLTPMS